jgi:hypothetical protein
VAAGARVHRLDDDGLFICVRHDRNTWRIALNWTAGGPGWTAIGRPAAVSLSDYQRYAALAAPVGGARLAPAVA